MTPAKVLALMDKRLDRRELDEVPIAKLAWLYVNAQRDPGDPEKGRPPAEPRPFDEFRSFKRKRKGLVTKDGVPAIGGAHNWEGVKTNKAAFEAWGKGKQVKRN